MPSNNTINWNGSNEETIKEIQDAFNKVLQYSQGFNDPNTDKLFEDWKQSKQYFIDKFGGKLIWQSPEKVYFPLSKAESEKKIGEFINVEVLYRRDNYELARFINAEAEGFFDNVVANEYETPSGEVIPKGMKLVRAFKFFVDDPTDLDALQTKASLLIQDNKIEGYFCISVHPLDFLSASENQYHWHSCHALDGEYRAGNLSYMCDTSTVICYLKGDDEVKLPHFPPSVMWNNKKWRMWLYLSDEHNGLFAGRQYPFTITNVLPYIQEQLFSLLGFSMDRWTKWHNETLETYKYQDGEEVGFVYPLVPIGKQFTAKNDLITDVNKLHYDDLLYSSYYIPYYSWRMSSKYPVHFTLGGHPTCPVCGQREITVREVMTCDSCSMYYDDDYSFCDICGDRHHNEEMYWVGDDHICERCFQREAVWCSRCGEAVYLDNAYEDDDGNYYCSWCWNRIH